MSRSYLSGERVEALREALSERDWNILRTVEATKAVTGGQLERLHFVDQGTDVPTAGRTRRRSLARLVERQILARLDRTVGGIRSGSTSYVYAMGIAGQRIMQSADVTDRRFRRAWTPGLSFMSHRLAITELYVRLVEAERSGSDFKLDEFVAEPDCWRSYSGRGGARLLLKPDAYVRLATDRFDYAWFVEVDRNTVTRRFLKSKCEAYIAYWLSGREDTISSMFPAVLWLVPDLGRADVLAGIIERLPADSRRLFHVGLFDDAVEIIRGGRDAAA